MYNTSGSFGKLKRDEAEIKSLRSLAEQFRKLADMADSAAIAYETGDEDGIESAMKDFTWEFLKMQRM